MSKGVKSKVMIGLQMRFHPVVETVDKLIGNVGKIFHISFEFGLYRPGVTWRHKLVEGGGVLKELSSHLFDLCRHWVGEVSSITAVNKIIEPGREVEDYSLNLMEFESGAAGCLTSNYLDRRSYAIKGNIMGIQGQIEFQFSSYDPADSKVTLIQETRREIDIEIPPDIDQVYPGHLDSFKKEIDYFVNCIVSDTEPPISCYDGLKAIEIINASYESGRKGTKVNLPIEEFSPDDLASCFTLFDSKVEK